MIAIWKKIIYVLIFTMFIYLIPFAICPETVMKIMYVSFALLYIILHKNNKMNKLLGVIISSPIMIAALWCYVLSLLWGGIVVSVCDGEFSYFNYWFIGVVGKTITLYFLLLLASCWFSEFSAIDIFFKNYIYAMCINVILTCMFLWEPSIKEGWFSMIVQSEKSIDMVENITSYMTRVGIDGFQGFNSSMNCSLGLLFCLYLNERYSRDNYYVFILVLLIGNVFYGRLGLLASLLILFCYLFKKINFESLKRIFIFCGVISIMIYSCVVYFENNVAFDVVASWALDPFNAFYMFLQGGEFSLGSSADVLETMYFLPSSDKTVIMGDGVFTTSNGYYMSTDVGYMRHMLFFGVIGEMLIYGSYVLCFYYAFKEKNAKIVGKIFLLMLLFLLVVGEAKGSPLSLYLSMLMIIIIGLEYHNSYEDKIGKNC